MLNAYIRQVFETCLMFQSLFLFSDAYINKKSLVFL